MTKKIFKTLVGISLASTTMICAETSAKIDTVETKKTLVCLSESCISTPELQKEVEKRSLEGDLQFEMGLELIKRWTQDKVTA